MIAHAYAGRAPFAAENSQSFLKSQRGQKRVSALNAPASTAAAAAAMSAARASSPDGSQGTLTRSPAVTQSIVSVAAPMPRPRRAPRA